MRGKEQGAKGHEWLKYSFGVGGDPLWDLRMTR